MSVAADADAVPVGPAYSVWLLPAEPLAAQLVAQVAALACVFATAPFLPHVTLQGDLRLRLADVVRATAAIADALPVQQWASEGIAVSESYFRSFYLAFGSPPAFAPAREQLATLTGTRAGLSPFAHLSLAYGPLDDARKQALRTSVGAALPGTFTFDRVTVALSGRGVGIPSWRPLQTFALSG